jgi:hypothetical protein
LKNVGMYNADGKLVGIAVFDGDPHDAERERFVMHDGIKYVFDFGEHGVELQELVDEPEELQVHPLRVVVV